MKLITLIIICIISIIIILIYLNNVEHMHNVKNILGSYSLKHDDSSNKPYFNDYYLSEYSDLY